MNYHTPVWSEINMHALAHNIRQIRSVIRPQAELMAVVKANAYGHGAEQVARTALANGATQLGVARVSEGLELRKASINAPILVLGYTVPEEYPLLLENNLIQTVYNLEIAHDLSAIASRAKQKAPVHIKIDTGMGRLGFLPDSSGMRDILNIARLPYLELAGIFTHFATADSREKSYARRQWQNFTCLLTKLAQDGIEFPCRHAANSAATLDMPETHLDMVRVGIALYGVWPSNEVANRQLDLQPVMTVKSRIAHIKQVPANFVVSYGATYITPAPTVIASIPVGYADGYCRLLSSRGEVLIHGQRAPVIGRVCMDQFMVDAGGILDARQGDEVVLLGCQDSEEITADEIAEKIDTISYEVLCSINCHRVPRYYI